MTPRDPADYDADSDTPEEQLSIEEAETRLLAAMAKEHPLLASDAPEAVLELAAACVDYVRQAVGVQPDGTADTLPLVDFYVRGARELIEGRPELEAIVVRSVGAYFGELVRPMIRGFWRKSGEIEEWEVCSEIAYLAVRPFDIAREGLFETAGPRAALRLAPEDERSVAERLAALPEVPEDEYFSLSTRLEAVEVVAEALRITAEKDGVEDVRFEADDYREDLD